MKKIILSTFVASSFLFAADYTNSIGMVFKEIPAGSFMMGTVVPSKCPKDNPHTKNNEYDDCRVRQSETPQHKVTLKGFYMAETEVTLGQWNKVIGHEPLGFPLGFGNDNPNIPVGNVNWYDAKEFIKRLNQKEGTDKYRLPTEEEWEYAARAGTTTDWYCGDDEKCVDSIAWYEDNSGRAVHPVKGKKPNAWGLYDMSGNVLEWVDSCKTENYNEGCVKSYKVFQVIRGGAYNSSAGFSRSAMRDSETLEANGYALGFRLLRMK